MSTVISSNPVDLRLVGRKTLRVPRQQDARIWLTTERGSEQGLGRMRTAAVPPSVMNVPHAPGSRPDFLMWTQPISAATRRMVARVGALPGPTSGWQKPVVTTWRLSLPTHLTHQVGPGSRSTTETNELGTVGPGSTEFGAVHTGGTRER